MDVKIALIGGGNVGQSFLALLRDKQDQIIAEHKISFDLTAICDRKAGSILSVDGLSIKEVLPMLEDGQSLHDYTPEDRTCIKELDPLAVIELSRADVIVTPMPRTPNRPPRIFRMPCLGASTSLLQTSGPLLSIMTN